MARPHKTATRPQEAVLPAQPSPADRAMVQAREDAERRYLVYVMTLHPRERAVLAPWAM